MIKKKKKKKVVVRLVKKRSKIVLSVCRLPADISAGHDGGQSSSSPLVWFVVSSILSVVIARTTNGF